MNKQEAYANVLENYFEEKEITVETLKEIIVSVGPVFGELQMEEKISKEDGKRLLFKDIDIYDTVVYPDGKKESKVTDMSTAILEMVVNKEDVITVIDHGMHIFTPANKERVLVMTSLIGKKIKF